MDDTSPETKKIWHEMLMARSVEERFMMGVQMFTMAREIIIATLPKDLPPLEFKRRLFERIYGFPLPEEAVSQLSSSSSFDAET